MLDKRVHRTSKIIGVANRDSHRQSQNATDSRLLVINEIVNSNLKSSNSASGFEVIVCDYSDQ